MQRVLILGSGFAGLWAAAGAARAVRQFGVKDRVEVIAVSRTPFHDIRVRNYEEDLEDCRIRWTDVLEPLGVTMVTGEVLGIDAASRKIVVSGGVRQSLKYDRVVLALGSSLKRAPVPGLAEYGFDVDTYDAAMRLRDHLHQIASNSSSLAASTVVVVGGGFTGVEVATELVSRLRTVWAAHPDVRPRVVIIDRSDRIGAGLGAEAQPIVQEALNKLGVIQLPSQSVREVRPDGVVLGDGEWLESSTIVWCAGMIANPLAADIHVPLDPLGRLVVNQYLQVAGVEDVFAAGDIADAPIDNSHSSVMSCQHARPMGRFAGHNAVASLLEQPLLPLHIPWYVTVVDLGDAGALYTEGWDRHLVATGNTAKGTKRIINRNRIYPPSTRSIDDILTAAAPIVQRPPEYGNTTTPES